MVELILAQAITCSQLMISYNKTQTHLNLCPKPTSNPKLFMLSPCTLLCIDHWKCIEIWLTKKCWEDLQRCYFILSKIVLIQSSLRKTCKLEMTSLKTQDPHTFRLLEKFRPHLPAHSGKLLKQLDSRKSMLQDNFLPSEETL